MSFERQRAVGLGRILNRFTYAFLAVVVLGAGCQSPAPGPSLSKNQNAPDVSHERVSWNSSPVTSTSTDLTPIRVEAMADRSSVAQALAAARPSDIKCQNWRAGVVNHHLLAGELQAEFFQTLARCRPDVPAIIILSPDHFQAATAPVIVTRRVFSFAGSRLMPETPAIDDLRVQVPAAQIDDQPFSRDHGIGAQIPFILDAFKDREPPPVVPIIVSHRITRDQATALADWLKDQLARGAFIVVSSDMSHYLTRTTALTNDIQTRRAFQTNEADFFWPASDDFTDNGKVIWTVMHALKTPRWHELAHSISTNFGGDASYTTSYITGYWE